MSKEGLAALRARVHADEDLAQRLSRIAPELFDGEIVRLAAEMGCDVAEDDLRAAAAQARQAWALRWIR